jgi:hypothetical protein
MTRVFKATFDLRSLWDEFTAQHRPDEPRLRDAFRLPLPSDLGGAIINRAEIKEQTHPQPPIAELAEASRLASPHGNCKSSIGFEEGGQLRTFMWGRRTITTFSPAADQFAVDICVRPLFSDAQLRKHVPRYNPSFAQYRGVLHYHVLPLILREQTNDLQHIIYGKTPEYRKKRLCGDVFRLWTYHRPTGPYDLNARATARFEQRKPLPEILHEYLKDRSTNHPVTVSIEYSPKRS